MATAYRSSAHTTYPGTNGNTLTIALPTGAVSGDVLLCWLHIESGSLVVPASSGWSLVGNGKMGTTQMGAYLLWKIAGGSEPANYIFTWTGAFAATGSIHAYSGQVNSGSDHPFGGDANVSYGGGNTATTASITYTCPGTGLGFFAFTLFNDGTASNPPTGWTKNYNNPTNDGSEVAASRADSAGTLSTGTMSGAASTDYVIVAGTLLNDTTGGGGAPAVDQNQAAPWLLRPPGHLSPATALRTIPGSTDIPQPPSSTTSDAAPAVDTVVAGVTLARSVADSAPAVDADLRYPYVAAASTNGRYFVDATGAAIAPQFYTLWCIVQQAGNTALNGGSATWQQDIDYFTSRAAALGFNAIKWNFFGQTINGAPNNDSRTWDSNWPFGTTAAGASHANPSAGLASNYWARVDYLIDSAAAAGLTCFIHVFYTDDIDSTTGCMHDSGGALKATSEFTALGSAIAARYKGKPNIVWVVGGDYFDTEVTQVEATFSALTSGGDTHLVTVQNNSGTAGSGNWTTSRENQAGTATTLGPAIATANACYIYDPTYAATIKAWGETTPIPVLYYDGYYDQNSGDGLAMRSNTAWALTYGGRGSHYGSEGNWNMPSGWRTQLGTPTPNVAMVVHIRQALAGYARWVDVVPDTGSTFITAGRGSGSTFVTGGRTSDGKLAIIYLPNAASAITVDTTQMVAGYTVTWIDPASGATSSGTTGTSFSHSGANSNGGADWLLVLAEPAAGGGSRSQSDTAGGTDSLTRQLATPRAVSDAGAGTDTLAKTAAEARALADTAAATDVDVRTVAHPRALAETGAGTDVQARALALPRSGADSAPAVDATSASSGGGASRSVSDSAPAADALARMVTEARAASDVAAATDADARGLAAARAESETAAGTDSTARSSARARALGDNAPASDTTSASGGGANSRSQTDAGAGTDALARAVTGSRAAGDTAHAVDNDVHAIAEARGVADSAPAADVTSGRRSLVRTLLDAAGGLDVLGIVRRLGRLLGDTAPAVDTSASSIAAGGVTLHPEPQHIRTVPVSGRVHQVSAAGRVHTVPTRGRVYNVPRGS